MINKTIKLINEDLKRKEKEANREWIKEYFKLTGLALILLPFVYALLVGMACTINIAG